MAALNFPSSPTDGQVHTENSKTWSWNAATTSWVSSNNPERTMILTLTDEITPIVVTDPIITFRVPSAIMLTRIPRASLTTVSSSGNVVVEIKANGTTILGSNKLSIDATELTSTTAATPTTLVTTAIADDTVISVSITSAGTAATGLKIILYYTR